MFNKATFVGALLASATFAAAPALAQSSTASSATSSSDDPSGEIIVTAQRRSESIQRVPVSVTAVSAETLATRQINDLSQLSRAAPSLQTGSDNNFAVRGVGTLAFAGTVDSSVAVAIDDVNLGRPLLNAPQFLDLERVEVLNGPQGLLFGKNASAGLLNVVTAKPVLNSLSSRTDLEFAMRDTPGANRNAPSVIARETINLPLGKIAALRLNGLYSYEESPISYAGTAPAGVRIDLNRRSYSGKAKLLVKPTEALTFYAIGDYNELHGAGGLFTNTYYNVASNSVDLPSLAVAGIKPSAENFLYGGDGGLWRDIQVGGAQASVSYLLDSGIEISNLAAWRFYDQDQQLDVDYLPGNGANTNRTVSKYNQYSNELRVALPAGNRLSGQVGLYYFNSTLDTDNLIAGNNYFPSFVARSFPFCVGATVIPGPPPNCSVNNFTFLGSDRVYTLKTESYAGFGQMTYAVTDALKLIAGGRLTHDKIDIDLTQGRNRYFLALGGPSGHVVQSYKNDDFSWKLGGQFEPTRDIMAYAFYGRGYKGPGFNDQAVTLTSSLVIRPEHSNTIEAGIKSSFFDRRVTLNLSAFTTKFDDFQVQSFDTSLRTFIVQNAATVRTKGIEAQAILRPFTGFSINAAATLLSAKFVSFPGAQCYPTQTTRGCTATNNVFDAGGLTLPFSPKFTSTVQARYSFASNGDVAPFIQSDWYHRSPISTLVNQAPLARIGTVDLFGLSVGAEIQNKVRVSLFCKNCTNEHVPTSIGTEPGDASATNNGTPAPRLSYTQSFGPDSVRSIGATLGFSF